MKTATIIAAIVVMTLCQAVFAQDYQDPNKPIKKRAFSERSMEGPRMGLTYTLPGTNAALAAEMEGIDPIMSEFGWHFEWGIVPNSGGPQLLVEFIPLISGVEYSKFYPSATLAMGLRLPDGFEFGMGPHLVITGDDATTSLVLAIGKSFDFSGISIPLNLAYVHNPNGGRLSFVFGYAIEQ